MSVEAILAASHIIAKIEDKAAADGVSILSALKKAKAEYVLALSGPSVAYIEIKREVLASLERMIAFEELKMSQGEIILSADMSFEEQMKALFGF